MMNLSEGRSVIKTAIEETVSEVLSGNLRPMRSTVITDAVMQRWIDEVQGPAADIALVGLHDTVGELVRKRMNADRKREAETPDPQLIMEGFERLQKLYVIDVDGEQTYVPVDEMTDEQIDAKADELRRFAVGAMKHADELVRYRDSRRRVAL